MKGHLHFNSDLLASSFYRKYDLRNIPKKKWKVIKTEAQKHSALVKYKFICIKYKHCTECSIPRSMALQ